MPVLGGLEMIILFLSDEVHTEIRYTPLGSDEVNNSVNFSDEVHNETQTRNEFIFSDEVFRFRYTPQVQRKWTTR